MYLVAFIYRCGYVLVDCDKAGETNQGVVSSRFSSFKTSVSVVKSLWNYAHSTTLSLPLNGSGNLKICEFRRDTLYTHNEHPNTSIHPHPEPHPSSHTPHTVRIWINDARKHSTKYYIEQNRITQNKNGFMAYSEYAHFVRTAALLLQIRLKTSWFFFSQLSLIVQK